MKHLPLLLLLLLLLLAGPSAWAGEPFDYPQKPSITFDCAGLLVEKCMEALNNPVLLQGQQSNCLAQMEAAMRQAEPFILLGPERPQDYYNNWMNPNAVVDFKKQWNQTKRECWKGKP